MIRIISYRLAMLWIVRLPSYIFSFLHSTILLPSKGARFYLHRARNMLRQQRVLESFTAVRIMVKQRRRLG